MFQETFYFAHDRIQEAAFALYSGEEKKAVHLNIARNFLQHYPLDSSPEYLFTIADHYNSAFQFTRIVDDKERQQVVQLNIGASERARTAVAFVNSLNYINKAIDHLVKNFGSQNTQTLDYLWTIEYDNMYKLHNQKAELELILSNTTLLI